MTEEIPRMDEVEVKRGDMVFADFAGRQRKGWLIREYTADDELVRYEYPASPDGSPKPFPLKPVLVEQDFPVWDGGGLDVDLEDEICGLEDEFPMRIWVIMILSATTNTATNSAAIRLSASRAFVKTQTAAC